MVAFARECDRSIARFALSNYVLGKLDVSHLRSTVLLTRFVKCVLKIRNDWFISLDLATKKIHAAIKVIDFSLIMSNNFRAHFRNICI